SLPVFGISTMGLFEHTFIGVKVSRGTTICCVLQLTMAVGIAIFPIHRICANWEAFRKATSDGWTFDKTFIPEYYTILIVASLFLSAILILIGNERKRYIFFIPALIVQLANLAVTIGAFFSIAPCRERVAEHKYLFACLCVALVLEYLFTVFYFKSFEYLRVFRG
ncbi:hypothetical protein PENTCL1PPCAC_3733, partial [Pristionchus entomophagus]